MQSTSRSLRVVASLEKQPGQAQRRPAPAKADQPAVANAGRGLAAAAAAVVLLTQTAQPALAELNRREAELYGEFNRGSAQQFGSMKMNKKDLVKEFGKDLRLSNFTAAEIRFSSLAKADLRGAYFIKVVAPGVDFSGADLTDALMDRGVFVDANFKDAVLTRAVLTLSDLHGADVTNADFSDALLDKTQQQDLCKTAIGTNPVTGKDTRKSLGCGGRPRGSPSAYMTNDESPVPQALFPAERFSQFSADGR